MKNGTHEKQERYSSLVLAKLRKESIFLQLFNRRYEGNPVAGAVKIPVRDTEVKVNKDYDISAGGELTTSATTYETLPIDKDLYVNELIDGYEAASVPDNLTADRLDSAGYAMGITIDSELSKLLIEKGTALDDTAALTKTKVYEAVVDASQKLKKLGVKKSEQWLAVTNETYGLLLKCPEFINASQKGMEIVQNGYIGDLNGIKVYETNNIDDASNVEFILGNNVFCHFVDEWKTPVAVNDLKDAKHIGASALQGRRVYGNKISRTNTVLVKKKAA